MGRSATYEGGALGAIADFPCASVADFPRELVLLGLVAAEVVAALATVSNGSVACRGELLMSLMAVDSTMRRRVCPASVTVTSNEI